MTAATRGVFAHSAVLSMAADGDLQAPGAAITVALCGQWEHEPPCPLAPHHTQAERVGHQVRLRTLFATEPGNEPEVRRLIEAALSGEIADPARSGPPQWRLVNSQPSAVQEEEYEHANRLASS
ncbi:MAG TPA: hypothetical protein VFP89_12925 [Propionibacteriaceae bacterium]|nr:hypothetical protein [Propionibacteriaceae bacterium]